MAQPVPRGICALPRLREDRRRPVVGSGHLGVGDATRRATRGRRPDSRRTRPAQTPPPRQRHGKRGGARVIYYHVSRQHLILLIVAYAKNEQEDLDRKQLQILSTLIKSEFP